MARDHMGRGIRTIGGNHSMITFQDKQYPAPVETIADNHPVYVNGTKLVNGYPIIDDRHKDISRVNEFTNIGFSKEYIQYLTDARMSSYYFRGGKGKPIHYGSSLPGKPSYSKITQDNDIYDPDNYEIKHKVTFDTKDYFVTLNDHNIAIAPLKKTKAFKERFCKAVIWSLMNDPDCLRDKLKEISGSPITETIQETTIPEKKYCAKLPVFPIGFLPHLNLTITEERYTA
jgi:hypothetical protein